MFCTKKRLHEILCLLPKEFQVEATVLAMNGFAQNAANRDVKDNP